MLKIKSNYLKLHFLNSHICFFSPLTPGISTKKILLYWNIQNKIGETQVVLHN